MSPRELASAGEFCERDLLIATLVGRYVERRERGDAPCAHDLLALAAEHGDSAVAELRDVLAFYEAMRATDPGRLTGQPTTTTASPSPPDGARADRRRQPRRADPCPGRARLHRRDPPTPRARPGRLVRPQAEKDRDRRRTAEPPPAHKLAHALGIGYEHYGRRRAEVLVGCASYIVCGSVDLDVGGETIPYNAGFIVPGAAPDGRYTIQQQHNFIRDVKACGRVAAARDVELAYLTKTTPYSLRRGASPYACSPKRTSSESRTTAGPRPR